MDYRTGLICAVLANINRDSKKQHKAFKPQDFMPIKAQKVQTPEQMLEVVKQLDSVYGEPKQPKPDMTGKSIEEIKAIVMEMNAKAKEAKR